MKRLLAMALSFLMMITVFTGCAKAKDAAENAVSELATATAGDVAEAATEAVESAEGAAESAAADSDTAAAFFTAYMEAKSVVLNKITDGLTNNPDTLMTAMSVLGVSLSDLYMLPAMYFGLEGTSVNAALAMMGAKDVTYEEVGNTYKVVYKDAQDRETTLSGTYDKGKSLVCTGTTAGAENVFAEVYRTAFGYVGQFYAISDDGTATLYQLAISGEDGTVGITTGGARPAGLTGNESADFPASAKEWYAIHGSTITGVDSNGKSVNFEYVPSEDGDANG